MNGARPPRHPRSPGTATLQPATDRPTPESVEVRLATSSEEVGRCRALIEEVYWTSHRTTFSEHRYDLEQRVERWPHRYLMGVHDGEIAGVMGVYDRDTYVERFAAVRPIEFVRAGGTLPFRGGRLRELTKLSVDPRYRGRGLSRVLTGLSMSRAFLQPDGQPDCPVLLSVKLSLLGLWHRQGIRTRRIRAFPTYPIHDRYRSEEDPMEVRMILPGEDVPPDISQRALPAMILLEQRQIPSPVAGCAR